MSTSKRTSGIICVVMVVPFRVHHRKEKKEKFQGIILIFKKEMEV